MSNIEKLLDEFRCLSSEDRRTFLRACEEWISKCLGFTPPDNDAERAMLRNEYYGETVPCCECGEEYPRADSVIDGQIYCERCRVGLE